MAPRTVDELLGQLTIDEKIALLSGSDNWHTAPIPRLGIGAAKVTDGPNGARGDSMAGGTPAVCIPAAVSLAASFDSDLVVELGELLGRETVRKQSQLLLAPTINMARHPVGGRNFECFGEDPHLTARLAVAFVEGVQRHGVGACAKHLIANDVEYRRMSASSEVDERTLREVYLAPFEAVVNHGVWSLMAAYPKLNGVHCTEHHWLLTELLRGEWGFDGMVVSDWGATHDPAAIEAGMDLEMPGPPRAFGGNLRTALDQGAVTEREIDARVAQVLGFLARAGRLGDPEQPEQPEQPERFEDHPAERALVRRAGAEGMVLIRNTGILPLTPDAIGSVAVIGPNADPGVIFGGGSASVRVNTIVSPLDGIIEAFSAAQVVHAPGCLSHRYLPSVERSSWVGNDGLTIETFDGSELAGEPVVTSRSRTVGTVLGDLRADVPDPRSWSQRWSGTLAVAESGSHRFGVFAVGPSRVLVDDIVVCDNWTSPTPGDGFFQMASEEVVGTIDLDSGQQVSIVVEWAPALDELLVGLRFGHLPPTDEQRLFDDAVAAAVVADLAVVVVGLNADWETESHDRPMFGLPGRQDELVRTVAAANPNTVVVVNTGAAVDLPWLDDVPAAVLSWYPGQEFGGALADVLTGIREPGGRLPVTFPFRVEQGPTGLDVPGDGEHIHYREGLFIGHRWYDARGIEPRLPFGYGLSYTTFSMGDPVVVEESGSAVIEVEVINTGTRHGKAVIQGYVEPPPGAHTRPVRSLCTFAVARLDAGERTTVRLELESRAFAIWTANGGWHTPPGSYVVHLGWSSRELPVSAAVTR